MILRTAVRLKGDKDLEKQNWLFWLEDEGSREGDSFLPC